MHKNPLVHAHSLLRSHTIFCDRPTRLDRRPGTVRRSICKHQCGLDLRRTHTTLPASDFLDVVPGADAPRHRRRDARHDVTEPPPMPTKFIPEPTNTRRIRGTAIPKRPRGRARMGNPPCHDVVPIPPRPSGAHDAAPAYPWRGTGREQATRSRSTVSK